MAHKEGMKVFFLGAEAFVDGRELKVGVMLAVKLSWLSSNAINLSLFCSFQSIQLMFGVSEIY